MNHLNWPMIFILSASGTVAITITTVAFFLIQTFLGAFQ